MAVVNWSNPLIPWNPLSRTFFVPYGSPVVYYLWWIFIISWGNLLFNLLPIYPLDGGRLLHALLWFKLRYYKSTIITCWVGMIGSVLMAMYGLTAIGSWYGMVLIFLGISCFITCFSMRAATRAAGPYESENDEPDYAAAAAALERAKGALRTMVGAGTGVRFTPTLTFTRDTTSDTVRRMDELLARARAADADLARVRVGAKPAGEADPYRETGLDGKDTGDDDQREN
jgi:hypothetical protein